VVPASSAGLLLHRTGPTGATEVLLVHPGGPFWARRDHGAWSIPKGEHAPDEDPLAAAEREFEEELGVRPPPGPRRALGEVRQRGGKLVRAWAVEGDVAPRLERCSTVEIEWPRGSGRRLCFAEVDRAEWFDLDEARVRVLAAQVPLIDTLASLR
jgi:predicted NUDIX family NTP pyrophosphohydrolase